MRGYRVIFSHRLPYRSSVCISAVGRPYQLEAKSKDDMDKPGRNGTQSLNKARDMKITYL